MLSRIRAGFGACVLDAGTIGRKAYVFSRWY
jgi:hypothetical protein